MGTLTASQLEAEVRVHLGRRESEDTRLIIALNLAQMRIARMHRWEELESLTSDTLPQTGNITDDSFLDLSSLNIRDVYSIRITDGSRSKKLTRLSVQHFDAKVPDVSIYSAGMPNIYTIYNLVSLQMYPSPDAAYNYSIRYLAWPIPLVSGGAVPSELDQKDDMLITLASSYVYHSLGKDDKAKQFFGMYAAMLNEAAQEELEKPGMAILPDFEVGRLNSGGGGPYYLDPFMDRDP